jgi:F-type H+-transporting ATPase subunit b
MDDTLRALGQILLQALPTFFLVLFLHYYLKAMFFGPLQRILEQRRQATEGAREAAAQSLQRAEAKAADYEAKIQAARNEIYREQEEIRNRWREEQSAQVLEARRRAEALVKDSKTELAAQAAETRQTLSGTAQSLADQITEAILRRRPV